MKNKFKIIVSCIIFTYSIYATAQIGVGTENPKVTFDVNGLRTNTSNDGMLFPRLSKTELAIKTNSTYSTNQESSLVYVTHVSTNIPSNSPSLSQVENIVTPGYYYYGSDNKWHNFAFGDALFNLRTIYSKDDTILNRERYVNQDGKSLSFVNTGINTNFSIGRNYTDPTIKVTDLGVGIGSVNPTANLHIESVGNSFRLEDGTQFAGKFLTSDENGNASWYTGVLTSLVLGTTGDIRDGYTENITFNQETIQRPYEPIEIELTKGKWLVNIGTIFYKHSNQELKNLYLSLTLSSSKSIEYYNGALLPNDGFEFLGNSKISSFFPNYKTSADATYLMISGTIPVEVTKSKVVIYPWINSKLAKGVNDVLVVTQNYRENYIFALPLN